MDGDPYWKLPVEDYSENKIVLNGIEKNLLEETGMLKTSR